MPETKTEEKKNSDQSKKDEPQALRPLSYDPNVKFDERFQFGPPPIQTPQDAAVAFYREEITEEQFRAACGKFGVLPGQLKDSVFDRLNAAYHRDMPEEIAKTPDTPQTDVDERLRRVEEKREVRIEAIEKSLEEADDINVKKRLEEDLKVEKGELKVAEGQNR